MDLILRFSSFGGRNGNGGLTRVLSVYQNSVPLLNNSIFIDFRRNDNFSARKSIQQVMKFMGLTEEMINSDECVNEFILAIHFQGIVHTLPGAAVERDVFTVK